MRKARTLSGGKLPEGGPNEEQGKLSGRIMTALLGRAFTSNVPLYTGTVHKNVIDKRRKKSKVAKQSRKINRGK